jgi:hypothetical protein
MTVLPPQGCRKAIAHCGTNGNVRCQIGVHSHLIADQRPEQKRPETQEQRRHVRSVAGALSHPVSEMIAACVAKLSHRRGIRRLTARQPLDGPDPALTA